MDFFAGFRYVVFFFFLFIAAVIALGVGIFFSVSSYNENQETYEQVTKSVPTPQNWVEVESIRNEPAFFQLCSSANCNNAYTTYEVPSALTQQQLEDVLQFSNLDFAGSCTEPTATGRATLCTYYAESEGYSIAVMQTADAAVNNTLSEPKVVVMMEKQ